MARFYRCGECGELLKTEPRRDEIADYREKQVDDQPVREWEVTERALCENCRRRVREDR